jgi:hypothetical protein
VATINAVTADSDAIENPALLPSRRISNVAGMVVAATATTIIDTGNVAQV